MDTFNFGDGTTINGPVGSGAVQYNGIEKQFFDSIDKAKLTTEEKKELFFYLDSIKKGEKDATNKLVKFLKGFGINLASGIIANIVSKGF